MGYYAYLYTRLLTIGINQLLTQIKIERNEKKIFNRGNSPDVRHNAYTIVCRFVLVVQQARKLEQGSYRLKVPQRDYLPRHLACLCSMLVG